MVDINVGSSPVTFTFNSHEDAEEFLGYFNVGAGSTVRNSVTFRIEADTTNTDIVVPASTTGRQVSVTYANTDRTQIQIFDTNTSTGVNNVIQGLITANVTGTTIDIRGLTTRQVTGNNFLLTSANNTMDITATAGTNGIDTIDFDLRDQGITVPKLHTDANDTPVAGDIVTIDTDTSQFEYAGAHTITPHAFASFDPIQNLQFRTQCRFIPTQFTRADIAPIGAAITTPFELNARQIDSSVVNAGGRTMATAFRDQLNTMVQDNTNRVGVNNAPYEWEANHIYAIQLVNAALSPATWTDGTTLQALDPSQVAGNAAALTYGQFGGLRPLSGGQLFLFRSGTVTGGDLDGADWLNDNLSPLIPGGYGPSS